jgi:hypothetical protein
MMLPTLLDTYAEQLCYRADHHILAKAVYRNKFHHEKIHIHQ